MAREITVERSRNVRLVQVWVVRIDDDTVDPEEFFDTSEGDEVLVGLGRKVHEEWEDFTADDDLKLNVITVKSIEEED